MSVVSPPPLEQEFSSQDNVELYILTKEIDPGKTHDSVRKRILEFAGGIEGPRGRKDRPTL